MRSVVDRSRLRLDRGFTVVELLCVIGIIVLLFGLLASSLSGAKERARRVVCAKNLRQFTISLQLYGEENRDLLPRGGGEGNLEMHTSLLARRAATNLLRVMKSFEVMDCPNLHERFTRPKDRMWIRDWRTHGEGIAIGYHYLGGFSRLPLMFVPGTEARTNLWVSPMKLTDEPTLTILADLNVYGGGMTLAPHRRRGPLIRERGLMSAENEPSISPRAAGSQGGNVASLAGAVEWKGVRKMRTYQCGFGYLGEW